MSMCYICVPFQGAAKKLLYPVLNGFMEEFVKALTISDPMISDSGLKKEIIKVRNVCYDLIVEHK